MKKNSEKSYNYKLLIGIIIGMFFSIIGVYANTTYVGNALDLTYNNSNNILSSTNVQDALDELYEMKCPEGYFCIRIKNNLEIGDYVSLTPTLSSYTTQTSYTGYSSTQTINPQELNLWRVIKINDDGTAEIISEHVSSTAIYFSGLTGYKNLVGYLNILASKYENSDYTVNSRSFGYNSQTEYISANESTYFNTTPPWTSSTGLNTEEEYGGGDTLYTDDYNLIDGILGTNVATDINGTQKTYWIASRYYYYYSSIYYYWYGRYMNTSGYVSSNSLYSFIGSSLSSSSSSSAIRPILTLKSGLKYSGVGSEEYPMEVSLN